MRSAAYQNGTGLVTQTRRTIWTWWARKSRVVIKVDKWTNGTRTIAASGDAGSMKVTALVAASGRPFRRRLARDGTDRKGKVARQLASGFVE